MSKKDKVNEIDVGKDGRKSDGGKLEWSLLDLSLLKPVVYRYTQGKYKYSAYNWQKVDNARERYFNAAMRHLVEYQAGNRYDDDPRFAEYPSHLGAAIWNLITLLWFEREDERKEKKEK